MRCRWCNESNPRYVEYHDKEWCVPKHDDRDLFELLVLESFQAGLSWECILNKRDAFRESFDHFKVCSVASYDDKKKEELASNPAIVRNRRKIIAAIENAKVFIEIQKEFGTFDNYIWGFTNGETIFVCNKTSSELSDTVSKDLKQRGMRFVGTTIVYSYLQAIGVLSSHEEGCFLHPGRKS